ncbi:MAG: peptidylprolyl isomerase, partial [Desulfobulbaceae bacterium]|nr:peptidylprolyl isomerase [Desulfobulbaceae bacterium]
MTMGIVRGAIGAIVIAAILASSALAEEGVGFGAPDAQPEPGITFVLRGEELARSGDPFSAIAEFRRAIAVGYRQTEVYRSLSTVLYLAGFADQAIEALEEGIRLHPEEISPRLELGVLHFAVGHEAKAEKLFLEVVAANPTLANPYHYLGVIASRHKKDDEAWLFARRAQLLGHKDTSLLELLRARSPEPAIDQRQPVGDAFCFRQILVPSFEVAEEARQRLVQGEMFEVLAGMVSTGPSAANGGFVGCLPADELDGPLAAALWSQKPYGEPVIVETGRGAHVVQRVLSFDPMGWRVQLAELKRRPGKNGAGPAASVVAATAKTPASPAKVAAPAPVVTGVAVASVPPSLEADETRGRHAVHAGTYNGPVLAEAMVARLAESGFPATFHAVTGKDGAVSYRVVGGYYDDM